MASFFIDKLVDILINLTPKIKERFTWQGKYIKKAISETIRKEYLDDKKIFIPPAINKNPIPLDHPEKEDTSSRKSLIDYFINKVFIDKTDEPHVICLLGDTGSGKSAALAHLLYDYIHHYPAKSQLPFTHIKLISLRTLREDKDLNRINNMSDKDQTILLLDALDECPMAQDKDGYKSLLKNLKDAYSDFARVVITCRPQFFPDNTQQSALIPKDIENDTSFLQCENRYLSPFNDTQIDEFLSRKFSSRHESPEYKEAWKIIKENRLLFIRPLVLTYIDILIKSQQPIKTPLDVHYCIIHNLLKRDIGQKIFSSNVEQRVRNWWQLSATTAVWMYQNGKQSLTDQEFDSLLAEPENKTILSSDKARNFKHHSLLTRTGDEYHFSHRSFFEFFLAYHFLLHPDEIGYIGGLDFALKIFDSLYDAFTKGIKEPFSMLDAKVKEEDFAFTYVIISHRLYDLNHFSKALPRCQKAVDIFSRLSQTNPDTFLQLKATALNSLGLLHRVTNNHSAARKEFTDALNIRRQLAISNPNIYLPYVAQTLNSLGNLHFVNNELPTAQKEYEEALSIRQKLSKTHPTVLPDVATTLNNLAELHRIKNNHKEAGKEHEEALSIRRKLAEADPNKYLPHVAQSLNNLAILHHITDARVIAEKEYNEALHIRRKLAETNAAAFLPTIAETLNNLAVLHKENKNYDAAEEEYAEALSIRRQLAESNPDAFLPNVAVTLNNLAALHSDTDKHAAAEEEFTEVLSIRRQLAMTNPDVFLPRIANTLNDMAKFHDNANKHATAEKEYTEALRIRRSLAEATPDAFLPDVAQTLFNIALFHRSKGELDKAESAAKESLEIYRTMAEKSPAAFDPKVKEGEKLLAEIQEATLQHGGD